MNREAVILLLFDIPQSNQTQRREYARFVRNLKKAGFLMLQESIYIKHIRNISNAAHEKDSVQEIAPPNGQLLALTLTVKQFKAIAVLKGENIPFEDYCSSIIFL